MNELVRSLIELLSVRSDTPEGRKALFELVRSRLEDLGLSADPSPGLGQLLGCAVEGQTLERDLVAGVVPAEIDHPHAAASDAADDLVGGKPEDVLPPQEDPPCRRGVESEDG